MFEKYRKITIMLLIAISFVVSILLLDRWVLPQKTIEDRVVGYNKIVSTRKNNYGTTKTTLGYRYYTDQGYTFAVGEEPLRDFDSEYILTQSCLLKNINTVKTKKSDYSSRLTSGINGICALLIHILALSLIFSLIRLIRNHKLSKNQFQNVLLFNSFIIFITIYLWFVFN